MIHRVVASKRAQKELLKTPSHLFDKLQAWIKMVKKDGLEQVKRIPGFHDEPLGGERKGQRSIRLNKAYRAIYTIESDGIIECINIKEVTKHGY